MTVPALKRSTALSVVLTVGVVGCGVLPAAPPGDAGPEPDAMVTARSWAAASKDDEVSTGEPAAHDDGAVPQPAPGAALVTYDPQVGEPVTGLSSPFPVTVDVVSRDGGAIVTARDPWGETVLRFPAFSESVPPGRAVLSLRPDPHQSPDPLSPGVDDFFFGADFAVDLRSHGTDVDSGNNLLQRGLASDPSHFKLEVDARRPACRVHGPDGKVELRTRTRLQAGTWYRARCSRTGATVQLDVWKLDASQPILVEQVRRVSLTGDLQWAPGTPASVGGKLAANGDMIRSQTDQYNGLMSNLVLQIGD